jgi:hypothetical protein
MHRNKFRNISVVIISFLYERTYLIRVSCNPAMSLNKKISLLLLITLGLFDLFDSRECLK